MIILDATNRSLEIDLAGAITANELPFTVSYTDINQSTFAVTAVSANTGLSTGATAATMVSAPGATTSRQIKWLSIYNADTVNATVTVQLNDNTVLRSIIVITLEPGDTLQYQEGWTVMDSAGGVKSAGASMPSSGTDNAVLRRDGATGRAIQDSAVTINDSGAITATGGGSLTGTWTDLGSVTTIDINGGTIDGVTIGGAAAGAGTFTTLTATGAFTSLGINDDADAVALTIDSSERLLVGHTASISAGTIQHKTQVFGTGSIQGGISVSRWSADTTASRLSFSKSRGATPGTFTVVTTGDNLGRIDFDGADGTNLDKIAAQILSSAEGTVGASRVPGRLVFSTAVDAAGSALTEAMRIDSSQRLYFSGNASFVAPSTSQGLLYHNNAIGAVLSGNGTTNDILIANKNGNTLFSNTTGTQQIFIPGTATVGSSTVTPDGTLHVYTASAGAVEAHMNAKNLIVEGNGIVGISILTPAANDGRIAFGSPTSSTRGIFLYDHSADSMQWYTQGSGSAHMLLKGAQTLGAAATGRGLHVNLTDTTITGAATAYYTAAIEQVDITAATAQTISTAASLYIAGAPTGIGAGPATITNAYALFVDAGGSRLDGNVLISPSVPASGLGDGTLHVHQASAGTVTAIAGSDELVVEGNGTSGMSILVPDANLAYFTAGSPSDNDYAQFRFQYNAGSPIWQVMSSGGERFRFTLDSTPVLFINHTANDNMSIGLTINQGAEDNQILSFKSSDVSTGLTDGGFLVVEADDFFVAQKSSATLGGVFFQAVAADDALNNVYRMASIGGTADTAKTTSARGLVQFEVAEHNGLNAIANITNDGNVFVISARVGGSTVARFLIDEDGDMYSVTAGTTFDSHDDAALARAFDRHTAPAQIIRSEFDQWVNYDRKALEDAEIIGRAGPGEESMWNVTQHMRLLNGAVWQQRLMVQVLAEALEEASPGALAKVNARLAEMQAPQFYLN